MWLLSRVIDYLNEKGYQSNRYEEGISKEYLLLISYIRRRNYILQILWNFTENNYWELEGIDKDILSTHGVTGWKTHRACRVDYSRGVWPAK